MTIPEALLLGGRSGVGKSTVGAEVSAQLNAAGVPHVLIEGDYVGCVNPPPPDDPHRSAITERNLTAMWANFAALGHHRLVYTNTASVLDGEDGMFTRALGGRARLIRVLLTATDDTARQRLTAREIGGELEIHITRSARMATRLDTHAPHGTVRVRTDDLRVPDIARVAIAATGWLPPAP